MRAAGRSRSGKIVQQSERVVPPFTLVVLRVPQQSGIGVEGVLPTPGVVEAVASSIELTERVGELSRAEVGVGQVEGVRQRVHDAVSPERAASTDVERGAQQLESPPPIDLLQAVQENSTSVRFGLVKTRQQSPAIPAAAARFRRGSTSRTS